MLSFSQARLQVLLVLLEMEGLVAMEALVELAVEASWAQRAMREVLSE